MKPTRNTCIPFDGRPVSYQAAALHAHYVETGMLPNSWSWVTTTCGTACLKPGHMQITAPKKLGYAANVCIYCGRPGYTEDHLLPRRWSGDASRTFVVTVPSCGTCNSVINDTMTWSITERRILCHYRLRRKYRKALSVIEFGPEGLAQFEGALRAEVIAGMERKAEVEAMLRWPEHDPGYDLRACQKAGIEDPYASGLLVEHSEAARVVRNMLSQDGAEEITDLNLGFRTHGRVSTYRAGCRCKSCTKAKREHSRRMKNRPRPTLYGA